MADLPARGVGEIHSKAWHLIQKSLTNGKSNRELALSLLNVFFGIGATILAWYAWIRRNDGISLFLLCLATFVGLWSFVVAIRYEQDLFTHSSSRIRFCSESSAFLSCMGSWDYEDFRLSQISSVPNENICRFCPSKPEVITKEVIKYTPLRETDILQPDLPKFEELVGLPFDKTRFQIGKMMGIEDAGSLGTSNIPTSKGAATQYRGETRFDSTFPTLISYERKCLRGSQLRILVLEGRVVTLTWIGDISKQCFDTIWLPAIARQRDFKVDERLRSSGVATTIRVYDRTDQRLLIVTSRSIANGRDHVGIRLSVTSATFPLPNVYDDYQARGIFSDPEAIAQQ
jgi:hypothetical protein